LACLPIRQPVAGINAKVSVLADAGWGQLVKNGKQDEGVFSDELVDALAELVQSRWRPNPPPTWVTCVPSLGSPNLVPDFATRVAAKLGLPFDPVVRKIRSNQPQKMMRNSQQQSRNLENVVEVGEIARLNEPVLLVDDVVDSRWTMTVIAALIRRAGGGIVYPIALAEAAPKIEG